MAARFNACRSEAWRHNLRPATGEPMRGVMRHGYREMRQIGKGSYGVAMLVQDDQGNPFVMKKIDMGGLDQKSQNEQANEVKVLASLKHPYIVRYRESFFETERGKGVLTIVMDYAPGGDLLQRINNARSTMRMFPEKQILSWMTQASLGLKYVHGKHIIHRDLKSQNIFLTAKDHVVLGDFGISKSLKGNSVVENKTQGTPYYLAPEICSNTLYSFASDMWALGVVAYELAALRVPFVAQSINELATKITSFPIPDLPKQYSIDLQKLIRSLLNRDYKRRASASDIIQQPAIQAQIAHMLRQEQESGDAPDDPLRDSTSTCSTRSPSMETGAESRAGSRSRPQSRAGSKASMPVISQSPAGAKRSGSKSSLAGFKEPKRSPMHEALNASGAAIPGLAASNLKKVSSDPRLDRPMTQGMMSRMRSGSEKRVTPGDKKDRTTPNEAKERNTPTEKKDRTTPSERKDRTTPSERKDRTTPSEKKADVSLFPEKPRLGKVNLQPLESMRRLNVPFVPPAAAFQPSRKESEADSGLGRVMIQPGLSGGRPQTREGAPGRFGMQVPLHAPLQALQKLDKAAAGSSAGAQAMQKMQKAAGLGEKSSSVPGFFGLSQFGMTSGSRRR